MTDLPPMDPCPTRESGRHSLAALFHTEDITTDLTLYCEHCGAIRRLPATGVLVADRMDDMSADEIDARIRGAR